MKHADWHYLVMGLAILTACFAVIIMAMRQPGSDTPTEAWITVGAVCGHWFGRANGARSGLERRE